MTIVVFTVVEPLLQAANIVAINGITVKFMHVVN
ncbi:MAG: hypothetical protein K0R49_1399 [Burkholderiales bacterium]|nr:hypothetical protein [Burkholderiales bacterium]